MIWQPLADLCRRHGDIPRPLTPATVADVTGWAASGESWIMVRIGDETRRVIYRDGRLPVVGEAVQVIRMSAAAGAPYLALPLPHVALVCTLSTVFFVNGALTDPPDTLPQDGSLGDTIVRAQTRLGAGCRGIYLILRSYVTDYGSGDVVRLYQESIVGPIDGPTTRYVQVTVPGPRAGANAYYVQSDVGTFVPALTPGQHP